ncbi:type II toxin-antitoxin system HipA family toxin [Undibacterium sp. Di26W]|uniref:type II toxin-antitoxin system HipA family toxin n=1 Tax=Undibacterium sp. Di26W TaxID=3413035 RepID=UPI003BF18A7D
MATKKNGSFQKTDVIQVHVWGQYVGAVALDPAYGYYAFAYDPAFRRMGIELAPLHLPLQNASDVSIFLDLPEATYKRLPAMLADALPDDFGNALINRYMADKGIDPVQVTPLDRLAYMGKRSMGALEFKPRHGPRSIKPSVIEMSHLVTEARKIVSGQIDDDAHSNAALRSIIEVGTSAGGARAKAVIAWNRDTNEIRSGQASAPPGYEHWLLKFDGMGVDNELGSGADYGRIEYAYSLMAKQAGIQMMDCHLLQENGRAHFMTQRFDRANTGDSDIKHHIQTLCAMAHLDYKKKSANSYAQLFITILALKLPRAAMVEAFRRMVFNAMGRNCDDHTKNTSFLLRQHGAWELAPAYDISFSHNPSGEWTHQHLMSINGKFWNFTVSDLLQEADRYGIGEIKSIIRQCAEVFKAWPDFARQAGVSEAQISKIAALLWIPAL